MCDGHIHAVYLSLFLKMPCLTDPWHMLSFLMVFDLAVYALWCFRTSMLFHRLCLGVNFSFIGMLVYQKMFHDHMPERIVDHFLSHVALTMFFMLLLTFASNAVIMTLVLLLLGPFWNSARMHVAEWIGIESDTPAIVAITVTTFLIVLVLVFRVAHSRRVQIILGHVAGSYYGMLAINLWVLLRQHEGELCCFSNENDDTCPFTLNVRVIVTYVCLLIVRIMGRRRCGGTRPLIDETKKKGKKKKKKRMDQNTTTTLTKHGRRSFCTWNRDENNNNNTKYQPVAQRDT